MPANAPILAAATEQQFSEFEFAGALEGWWRILALLAAALVVYGVFWIYRREARAGAGRRLRMALAVVRCAVLALLALVWLEPVIATYTVRKVTARTVVLIDDSTSMSIADPSDEDATQAERSRIGRVERLLTSNDHHWLHQLEDRNDLMLYTFGQDVRNASLPWQPAKIDESKDEPPPPAFPLKATETHTDLGNAISRVLEDAGDSPIAGIVVLTDGVLTAGMGAESIAAAARRAKAPLYTVGVGDTSEPPNLRITNLTAPLTAAKGDPLELHVQVVAAGVPRGPVQVVLDVRRGDGAGSSRTIERKEVELGGDEPTADLAFTVDADQAGEFLYTATLERLDGEAVDADNTRDAIVRVLDQNLRVLIVAGRPSYDYRYVTRLFERDKTIDVSCWLQSADATAIRDGDTPITELPRRPQDIFAYDAILLMDPNPEEFESSWAITVRRLVDEFGGGLLLEAGAHATTRLLRDPRLEDLVAILPIAADPDADVRLSEQGAYRTRGFPMQVPDDAWGHPLLRMNADPGVNRAIWAALPDVWWRLPVLRAKPLAAVLLQLGAASLDAGGQPILLAAQPFGSGRTAFLAFDGMWRWRASAERYFDRFWVQLVRYLGQARREGASKRGAIVLERDEVDEGDLVEFEVRVLDEKYVPWHERTVEAKLAVGDAEPRPITLEAIAGREGWFAGRLAVDWTGTAQIQVPLPGSSDSAKPETLTRYIQAKQPDVEMQVLRRQTEPLMRLAEETGGTFVPIEDAQNLPNEIERATRETKGRAADRPLWDNPWLLTMIATLLGVEWTLRRRNHLL